MTHAKRTLAAMLIPFALTGAAQAQLSLPGQLPTLGNVLGSDVLGEVRRGVDGASDLPNRAAQALAEARSVRIGALVRAHPDRIAIDPDGFAARAGEVVVDDADDALIAKAAAKGYTVIERGDILGVGFVRLATPPGQSLKTAIRELK